MRPDDLDDLSRFLGELHAESERGLALIAASVLDDKLRATLAAFFVQCNAVSRLLDGANAPLGSFSARTDACYSLGLIDQFEYEEIGLVRKVRNEFAHGLHGTTFRGDPVIGYCSSLKSNLPEGAGHPTNDPRFRFTNAVVSLTSRLYYRPEWVAKERRVLKEWISADQVRWRSVDAEPPPVGTPVLAIGKLSLPERASED